MRTKTFVLAALLLLAAQVSSQELDSIYIKTPCDSAVVSPNSRIVWGYVPARYTPNLHPDSVWVCRVGGYIGYEILKKVAYPDTSAVLQLNVGKHRIFIIGVRPELTTNIDTVFVQVGFKIIYPKDGNVVSGPNVEFRWTQPIFPPNVTGFCFSRAEQYIDPRFGDVTADTSIMVAVEPGWQTWRVSALVYPHRVVWVDTVTFFVSPGTVVNASTSATPASFSLEQNYPNPFNPSTTIAFSLPQAGQVYLAIYDLSGREVTVLISGKRHAGEHQVRWDAGQLSAGLYFARLKVDHFTKVIRMSLVK